MGRNGPEQGHRNSIAYQEQLLYRAAAESQDRPAVRVVAGPFVKDFTTIFTSAKDRLKDIDSNLPYDAVLHDQYGSVETAALVRSLNGFKEASLDRLRRERREKIRNLALGKITQRLGGQEIRDGLLAKPKFTRMADSNSQCMNACFRMISGDILGLKMQEDLVENAVRHGDSERVIPDNDYWNLLLTDAFRQEAGRRIRVARFVGAELDTISQYARTVTDLHPELRVYCVASIRGKSKDYEDTLHSVVLLNATQGSVFVHDPAWTAGDFKGDTFAMQKSEFIERWAAASNSGVFVVE